MKLRKLAKDPDSGDDGCQACYVDEHDMFVIQGDEVDDDTRASLENMLAGEGAVQIKPSIVIEAVLRYLQTR